MTTTYRTRQGDMIDAIAWQHYGFTRTAVEAVLEANPGLDQQPARLPAGVNVVLPDLAPPPTRTVVRLWD